ncbi:GDP-fucose protein O-fucosyltransferase 1-like protein, partial [Leptotrombidium deliense]
TENRVIMCYKPRGSQEQGCNPFEGNPFKPFWHHFNITKFVSSDFHHPLVMSVELSNEWIDRYKSRKVLSFVGAPSSFPTIDDAIPISKYIHFTAHVEKIATEYRELRKFARLPYLAVHLRHGSDWVQIKACNLLKENEMTQFFSSHQCATEMYEASRRPLPYELCHPSFRTIANYISEALKNEKNIHQIEIIYFSTDFDDKSLFKNLKREFPNITLITPSTTYSDKKFTGFTPPHYIIDLYLMVYSNFFIGNCISSFTAFASRIRVHNFHFRETTKFFADLLLYKNYDFMKDEL